MSSENYLKVPPYLPGHGQRPHLPSAETPVSEENFSVHEIFNLGLELHKWGYFWEAHEVLESLWHLQDGDLTDFIQVLIQRSAARLKIKQGDRDAAQRILKSAQTRLDRLMNSSRGPTSKILGIDLRHLKKDLAGT